MGFSAGIFGWHGEKATELGELTFELKVLEASLAHPRRLIIRKENTGPERWPAGLIFNLTPVYLMEIQISGQKEQVAEFLFAMIQFFRGKISKREFASSELSRSPLNNIKGE